MTQPYVALADLVKVFNVHPRTILRAVTGDRNAPWSEDETYVVALNDMADAYGTRPQTLRAVLEGRDALLRPEEAAKLLKIQPRTFRDRVYAGRYKKIANGRIVRYLRSKILEDKIASSEE